MKRILITGVTGFVGSSLVKYFNGQETYLLFGHSRDVNRARQQFQHEKIELLDDCRAAKLDELKIDCIIHLAGIAHDMSNQYQQEDYEKVNYENTKRTYDQFLKSGATKFIYLSSIKAAVDVSKIPATEDIIPQPVTDYGKSKLKAEQYIESITLPSERNYYIFRPCMIHGPGNKGNLNLLYRFVKAGIPYPFGGFKNQRSFLGIDNFLFTIHQFIEKQVPSGIYHLADEGFLSTGELYEIIATALGRQPRVVKVPRKWVQVACTLIGRRHMLNKLTEDLMVSNIKLLTALNNKLPVTLRDGLVKTIKSFS
jgi:nucleoside-diphosphate-sugar epimerase